MNLDFVCLGGNKCGTTWFHTMLAQHPDLNLSIVKEPHFFTFNFIKGINWYKENWDTSAVGKLGECSTSYLYSKEAMRRLKTAYPQVKLFVILRNPVERSVSHFRHLLRYQNTDDLNQFLSDNKEIIENSLYSVHLVNLLNFFQKENIKVLLFDSIKDQPITLLKESFCFLGVDSNYVPDGAHEVVAVGYDSANKKLEYARVVISRFLKKRGMGRLISLLKRKGLTNLGKSSNNEILMNDVRAIVLQHIEEFRNDIDRLNSLNLMNEFEMRELRLSLSQYSS